MKEGVMDTAPSTTASLPPARKPYKVILLGDSKCGKSSLLKRYTKRSFTEDYVPTVFDSGSAEVVAEQNNDIKLNIWDTSGSSEFDHIRPLSFGDAAVFVLCFDIEKPTASLENINKKWLPEAKSQHSDKPIVVVGCKADLKTETKSNSHKNAIICPQGMAFAKQIGAFAYMEASSKNDEHIQKIDKLFKVVALLATGQINKVPKDVRPKDVNGTKPDAKCTIM